MTLGNARISLRIVLLEESSPSSKNQPAKELRSAMCCHSKQKVGGVKTSETNETHIPLFPFYGQTSCSFPNHKYEGKHAPSLKVYLMTEPAAASQKHLMVVNLI